MRLVLFANTDWYLYNFRRSLALALRDAGFEVLLLSPDGPYGARLRELGLRWEPVPMDRRSLSPLRETALLWHLWRLFLRERPALVHGFTIKCAVYGSLAARLAGVPGRVSAVTGLGYVFTSDDAKARWLRPLVRGLMRLALGGKRARLILQNPDDVALFERARLVAPARIRLIPGSGVDCTRFAPANRGAASVASAGETTGALASGADSTDADAPFPFRVLLPARLLWDKGLADFVAAARLLRAQGRAIDFLLAGTPDEGNPAAVPQATVQGWVDEGLLQWLGHVDDMPALFRSVDVMILPSYREGLPKGLIEAAACGLPLVTTDVPGCREVVTDGENGLLVPVRNASILAAAIARLHDDPALAQRLGAAARQRTLAEFDERIVIDKTMAVYREVLPDGR
jgi:glycosyltransferase involved in cell wall biosynthesis